MIQIDKIAYSSSLQENSPIVKCIFALGTLFLTISKRNWLFSLIVFFIMSYSTVRNCRITFIEYCKVMLIPTIFLLLSTFAIIFNISKVPMEINLFYLWGYFIGIISKDIIYAVNLVLVCISSFSCLFFLSSTTPLNDLIYLLRKCKVPWLFIELSVLIYRYIFVVDNMAKATLLAQNCRLGNSTFKRKIKDISSLIVSVFVRSLNKSQKIYEAMEARCYNGKFEVLWERKKVSNKEKIFIGLYMIAIVSVYIFLK